MLTNSRPTYSNSIHIYQNEGNAWDGFKPAEKGFKFLSLYLGAIEEKKAHSFLSGLCDKFNILEVYHFDSRLFKTDPTFLTTQIEIKDIEAVLEFTKSNIEQIEVK